MILSPVPVYKHPSKIWTIIREKGPLYLHSINQVKMNGETKCFYTPVDYKTKVQAKITVPQGLVVAILSDFIRQSPNTEAGWLSHITLFLIPNNYKYENNK